MMTLKARYILAERGYDGANQHIQKEILGGQLEAVDGEQLLVHVALLDDRPADLRQHAERYLALGGVEAGTRFIYALSLVALGEFDIAVGLCDLLIEEERRSGDTFRRDALLLLGSFAAAKLHNHSEATRRLALVPPDAMLPSGLGNLPDITPDLVLSVLSEAD